MEMADNGDENGGFILKTHQMFSVHTTLEEFENGGFTLKTPQMFSITLYAGGFKNATIARHFGFVFEKNSVRKITYRDAIVFEKLRFKIFSVHTKMKSRRFQIPPF